MDSSVICGLFITMFLVGGISISAFFYFIPIFLWITALASGANVKLGDLIGMRLKGIPPKSIILPLIMATPAGLDITMKELVEHYLAGGRVNQIVSAMIAAKQADRNLTLDMARTLDLRGLNVGNIVKDSIKPKVLRSQVIEAMSPDGFLFNFIFMITVRTDLERINLSEYDKLIMTRLYEAAANALQNFKNYREVLDNTGKLCEMMKKRDICEGTSLELISIDLIECVVNER